MGTWGPKLYQDDIAQDVRDYYKDQLHRGKTGQEITQELIKQNEYAISDIDDAPTFWFALADTQWNLGRLEDVVKEKALYYICNGYDLRRWEAEDPKGAKIRAKVIEELQRKLLSSQPVEKKISQYKLYRCEWKIGDVFAYQFNSEHSKDNNFYQKYVYFVKVDEVIWYPGHIVPVVYFYKKVDSLLSDINSLRNIEFIPQFYKPIAYENNPSMKKKYLLTLLNTSSRIIPKKQLTFLGNIRNIKRVEYEDLNSYKVNWKHFETYMIDNFKVWL